MFFSLLLKTLKACIKTLNNSLQYPFKYKKHRKYESNKVNNRPTAVKHSLCPGNGVFAREKCIIFVILYVFFFNNNKNRTLKNIKKYIK